MLTRVVKMTFLPEFTSEFTAVFKEVQPKIAASMGCGGVTLLQDKTDATIFFTISYWDDDDALNNYRHSELFTITWARIKPHFAARAEAWSLLNK